MTKVHDWQVDAAVRAHGSTNPHERTYERMRAALEAALSAVEPGPEIVVTPAMTSAGQQAALDRSMAYTSDQFGDSGVNAIYRAMRALEPERPTVTFRYKRWNPGDMVIRYVTNERSGKERRVRVNDRAGFIRWAANQYSKARSLGTNRRKAQP